jgi:hypothetical protein
MKKRFSLIALVLLISACSSMLPKAHTDASTFQSYDEARAAVEKLVPMKSDRQAVEKDGFNPATHPNIKLLTHADVVRLFVPTSLLRREDLDPGILKCLEARDACHGMEVTESKMSRVRAGNFLTDFTNFKRRTETTGWRLNALILFVDDLMVYRSWGGQPAINEVEIRTNPLGPFQDIGPALVTTQ